MSDVVAVVLYSNEDESKKFDLDYYHDTHMPLVMKHWGPLGLKSYTVTHFKAGLGGQKPPYRVQASLYWENEEAIKTATESESAKIVFGDVPNFTDITPQLAAGGITSRG